MVLVDAAIIFADILPPLEAMGLQLEFINGEGPLIHNPIRSASDVDALGVPDPEERLGFTLEAIRLTRRELAGPASHCSVLAVHRSPWLPMPSKGAPAATFSTPKSSCWTSPPSGIG
jgi:uroporphyrinogen-III decarboxylase